MLPLVAAALMAHAVPAGAQDAAVSTSDMDALIAAAQQEGALNVIALPRDWCNYAGAIDGFKALYGLEVNEINPLAGSGDEIQAIIANKDNTGPAAPDVIDVGLSFGPQAVEQGLLAPYKVSTWDDIPDAVKDADGHWYGDYYGVLAFETNTAIQPEPPTDWADLLDPRFMGQVALAGDPNVANQAIQTVYASALANGGSLDDVTPGLDLWRQIVDVGNFVPVIAKPGTIDQGATPVTIRWNYNALAHRDAAEAESGTVIDVRIPASGPFGGVYVQGISAFAPHPSAARLWQEYLYSDAGQNEWLKGYCYPIRFDAMKTAGTLDADALARLPDASGATFPTLAQLDAAQAAIADPATGWNTVVGAVPVDEAPAP